MHQSTIFIIIALILFSIFRRVSKMIGWQMIHQGKMTFRIVFSIIIGLLILIEGIYYPISLISDVAGILIGIILAYYSSVATQFEQREKSWYYRPNKWFGFIVIAIFFGRLIYRFYMMYMQGQFSGGHQGGLQSMGSTLGNSWTTGLILIMFAYYTVYYAILLRKQKQLQVEKN